MSCVLIITTVTVPSAASIRARPRTTTQARWDIVGSIQPAMFMKAKGRSRNQSARLESPEVRPPQANASRG